MSDESSASAEQSTSITEGLSDIAESVENAVSGEAEGPTEGSEQSAEPTDKAKLEATVKDPKASKAQKKEAAKQLKKIKFQVDGQEFEEEYDPNDENYMKEQLQFAKVARKRMQEKALIEKEVNTFLEDLFKNPKKALSDPAFKGRVDLKDLAKQIIEEEIENSKKSPEQLKLEEAQAELKALKEAQEKDKETREASERERLTEQEYERLDILMSQALEKNKFPKNPAVIKRMADYMLIGLEAGKDITPDDIVPLIREDLKDDYKEILNSMPDDDALEEFIGKEFVDRIRRKNIAKAKKVSSNPAVKAAAKPASTGQKTEVKEEKPKMNYKDFFKM